MKYVKEVLKNNGRMILFYLLIGIAIQFLDLYSVTYYQKILDAFQFHTLTLLPLIVYGVLLSLSTLLGYVENYPEQQVKNKLYLDFKLQALKKLKTMDYLEYQKIGTGRLTQKVEDGSAACRDVLVDFWFKLFRQLLPTALFSLWFISRVKFEYVFFVFAGYVFVFLISNLLLKRLYSLKEKILVNQEYFQRHLVRGFMEFVVFRTNKKYDSEYEVAKGEANSIVDSKTKIKLVHELFFSLFSFLVNILQVVVLGYAVLKSDLSVGAVVTVIALLGKAYEPIAIFNVEYVDYKLNKIAVDKYCEFFDLSDDLMMESGESLSHVKGNVSFSHVSFSYSDKPLVSDLSLSIPAGCSVAFVGESGAGKSTVIKLLMGFLKPSCGEIRIDDADLSRVCLNSYYDYVTYVSQEVPIFDGTLRENLVFDKKVSDEKIMKVLHDVCLDTLMDRLDDGLETQLGERGVRLSGGEKQRVALARLFFDDAKIVVLDEATSALDNITEKAVMKKVLEDLSGKTFIIIAHRLESIKDVDQIFVLRDGGVVESGTYKSLVEKDGYFKKLYHSKV